MGPKFNNIKRDFVKRNSMGFDEVINGLQDEFQPIITNVTDNIFYFAFITWSINDYLESVEHKDRTEKDMMNHFKLQNYFFSTSFLLKNFNLSGASGSLNIRKYILNNSSDVFEYNSAYIETLQTTIGYYKPGLAPLLLLETEKKDSNESLSYPQITPYGKELARVFESYFVDTEYYKNYRTSTRVPKNVLEELGSKISFHLENMSDLKEKMLEILFNNKYNDVYLKPLTLNKDYLLYAKNNYPCNIVENIRKIQYDFYSPRSLNYSISDDLVDVAKKWEIVMGRQYYTLSLSMIWKHMLHLLDEPMTEEQWINKARDVANNELNKYSSLEDLCLEANYTYEERESMIRANVSKVETNLLADGLKLMLSVYNRFYNRKDLGDKYDYYFGIKDDLDTMQMLRFFRNVEVNKKIDVLNFLTDIMKQLIIQNKIIGYKKLQKSKNGYYYEYNNGYYYKLLDFDYDYAGNRMINLYIALEYLDVVGDVDNE